MIEVAAAIIENEHKQILIARRKKGKSQEGLWEFPGGKLEEGETAEDCLKRELQEEMEIAIRPYRYFSTNDHIYGSTHIRLIAFLAKFEGGQIKLIDHDAYKWIDVAELSSYEFAPADMKFVEMLLQTRKK